MGLWKGVNKTMSTIHDVAVGTVGQGTGKVIAKGVEKAPKAIDKGAGFLNKTIKWGVSATEKIKSGQVTDAITEGVGKVTRGVLTNEDTYTRVASKKFRNVGLDVSNRPLILDELNSRVKSVGDKGAAIFDAISKDTRKIPFANGKEMPNWSQLIKRSDDSALGWRVNKRGMLVASAGAMVAGAPSAGKQFVDNRRGTNYDQQVTSVAPRVPAYAQNGGATGDLVFALNNLRHGGMM